MKLRGITLFAAGLLALPFQASADGPSVIVSMSVEKAAPRAVEDATRNRITADYRLAWANVASAMETNSLDPLQDLFTGSAKTWLSESVSDQRKSGLSTLYTAQRHKIDVAFYAPEGDVIELHDTASYHLQITDRGKPIQDQSVVQRYVVLMTPGADRWVIRQLQAVSRF